MEKERRIKGLSIVALLIAVVGLTIAFAAMNRTLNINNTTAKVGKFNVRFVSDSTNFPSEKNYEYKYMGDSGVDDSTNLTNSVISSDGSTVSGLHPVFNMTGITARYILKIHNDSASMVKVNQIVLPQECDNGESDNIVCSLKNLGDGYNKTIEQINASSNVEVNNTTIEAGESIYVSFNIEAKNDNTLIGQDQEYSNLTLSMTFMQAESVQEQGGGSDPISVDDNHYNLSFKDSYNSADIESILGDADTKFALIMDENDKVGIIGLAKSTSEECSNCPGISFTVIENESEYLLYSYVLGSDPEKHGFWYRNEDLSDKIKPTDLSNIKILDSEDIIEMDWGGLLETGDLMTPSEFLQLFDVN